MADGDESVIPKGWEYRQLCEIATVSSGGTPSRKNPDYWNGNVPWITTTQIAFNTIYRADEYISVEGLNNSSAKIFEKGTILIAMYGQGKTRGQVAKLGIDASINQACAAVNVKKDAHPEYIFHYLVNQYNHIRNLSQGSHQANLTAGIIKLLPIPLPPFPEQRKIAQILSTWDKAIELTEQLIAAKERRKKALMQRLLTDKVRFPGFTKPWEEVRLDSVSKVLFSNVDKKLYEGERDVYLCNYLDVYYNNYITPDLEFMPATASQREIDQFSLKAGDVIITKDSEIREDIAVSAVVSKPLQDVICGYHLAIIRPVQGMLDGTFLSMLLKTHHIRYYFSTLANGVTRFGLPQYAVKHAMIKIPSIEEQKRIADVFEMVDQEIETLNAQKDFVQQQKKGLMQQLLTGMKKVKV